LKKTLYLAEYKFGGGIDKELVGRAVRECVVCRIIGPSPVQLERGVLEVN